MEEKKKKKIGVFTWKRPLIFESKVLCLSLLYLVTTVSVTLYAAFSDNVNGVVCISSFRQRKTDSGNNDALDDKSPLFRYPSGYGEHKHAIPGSTSSCNSPLLFADYSNVYDEIHTLCTNSSSSSSVLRYLTVDASGNTTFAGNFSTEKRKSFFNLQHTHDRNLTVEVPCGFLKQFPIHESDRKAMEECRGVVVASAVFGDYDKIRQPIGLGSRTLSTVCFFMFIDSSTLASLHAQNISLLSPANDNVMKIGAWRIVLVGDRSKPTTSLPYKDPAMNGVIPKHLIHRLFPNSKYSVWVDAKLQLTVDPLLLLHSLAISTPFDMAISNHPFHVHTMEEAIATARWNKWHDLDSVRMQMETYCYNGLQPWSPDKLPYTSDVPDTALIVRKHGFKTNLFSCLLFNELEGFNPRDQLAFAYVRDFMNPKIKIRMFDLEVFEKIAIEYRHNLKPYDVSMETRRGRRGIRAFSSSWNVNGSSCHGYLTKMWGESDEENGRRRTLRDLKENLKRARRKTMKQNLRRLLGL